MNLVHIVRKVLRAFATILHKKHELVFLIHVTHRIMITVLTILSRMRVIEVTFSFNKIRIHTFRKSLVNDWIIEVWGVLVLL